MYYEIQATQQTDNLLITHIIVGLFPLENKWKILLFFNKKKKEWEHSEPNKSTFQGPSLEDLKKEINKIFTNYPGSKVNISFTPLSNEEFALKTFSATSIDPEE